MQPGGAKSRRHLELPGYYRPEKQWDMLVLSQNNLVAAIEFKAQAGSFGNNVNNRAEEEIGSAEDIWKAYREERFGKSPEPFLGYVFLLEDDPEVHRLRSVREPFFSVDPAFRRPITSPRRGTSKDYAGVSYSDRYQILCQRLKLERLYTATCFLLATRDAVPRITQPSEDLAFRRFMAALIGHATAIVLG